MELALRITVAVVLAWAGVAKLARLGAFATTLATHGVPARARRPVGAGLALCELVIAGLLLVGSTARPAAIAATSLFGIFTLALLRLRRRGQTRTACRCFGSSRPASTVRLAVRSGVLTVAAAALAIGLPAIDGPERATVETVALALLGVVTIALTLAVLGLYRQVGVLSLRLSPQTALELEDEGPALGQPAPLLPGLTRSGDELVAFVSLGCRMCVEIIPGLRALSRDGLAVHWMREDRDEQVFEQWGVPGTPYVVHILDGVVQAKGLVNTLEQIDWVIDIGRERHRHAA